MSVLEIVEQFIVNMETSANLGVTDIVLTDDRYFEFVRTAVPMLRYSATPITSEMIKQGPWLYRNVRIRRAPHEIVAIPGDEYTAGADFSNFIESIKCKSNSSAKSSK